VQTIGKDRLHNGHCGGNWRLRLIKARRKPINIPINA